MKPADRKAGKKTAADRTGKLKARIAVLEREISSLKESEIYLARSREIARYGCWSRNIRTGEGYWSDELYRIFGYEPGEVEISFELLQDSVHPEDRDRLNETFREALEGKAGIFNHEYRFLRKDGAMRWAHSAFETERDERGPVRFVGVLRDITTQKNAEMALHEDRKLYRILADNMADGVCILQKGAMEFLNPAFCSIFGYPESQLLGKDPVFLFREDHRRCFSEMAAGLEKGVLVERFAAPCVRRDGREIWTEGIHNAIEWRDMPAILVTVRDVTHIKLREMEKEKERPAIKKFELRESIKDRYRFRNIVGKSLVMRKIYEMIIKAAESDDDVIIEGESGSGKELVARTIHDLSARRNRAFVPVNCGAIPETLFESEFFGHRKGAFTGAYSDKRGFFDLADGGTLFLDEVVELNHNMQVKLLRALEGGEFTPVGSAVTLTSDIRIISATNNDLNTIMKKKILREDFFYRIHVLPIKIPPLRERKEDIPLLVDDFRTRFGNGKKLPIIPGAVYDSLIKYDWPGNIRELHNALRRYFTLEKLDFIGAVPKPETSAYNEEPDLRKNMESVEKQIILASLEKNRWHRANTAKALGIQERSLYRKLKKHGIKQSDFK